VFCNTGESWSEEMRQACFDYLRLGGIYAQGPISLLSGLNPRPFILVAHFFMVALYGVRPGADAAARWPELTPTSAGWPPAPPGANAALHFHGHALAAGRQRYHSAHHPCGGRARRVLPGVGAHSAAHGARARMM
jgi:hypothetical protein